MGAGAGCLLAGRAVLVTVNTVVPGSTVTDEFNIVWGI